MAVNLSILVELSNLFSQVKRVLVITEKRPFRG